jgi:hypothetical protein
VKRMEKEGCNLVVRQLRRPIRFTAGCIIVRTRSARERGNPTLGFTPPMPRARPTSLDLKAHIPILRAYEFSIRLICITLVAER